MESIVLELQKEAMSSISDISNLLRKSLVIARKLKIKDFALWVNQELDGYKESLDDIPNYRNVYGKVEFFNPYYGWRPVIIEDEKLFDQIANNSIAQPITELEYLLQGKGEDLIIQLSPSVQSTLSRISNSRFPTEFRVIFGKSQARQIIDTVRKIVLDWSIQLEEDGILGEGILFSEKEKQEASKQSYTVNNFYGSTSGVQIQQHTQHSTQTQINQMDLEKVESFLLKLQENLNELKLDNTTRETIEVELSVISKQLQSNKPETSIIRESMSTIRNIIEGVSGSLIASGLLHELSKITM